MYMERKKDIVIRTQFLFPETTYISLSLPSHVNLSDPIRTVTSPFMAVQDFLRVI